MDRKPGVIVLGGHVQGYGIVRVYGENGIPSIVIDTSKYNIAKHSKYCVITQDEWFRTPRFNAFINELLNSSEFRQRNIIDSGKAIKLYEQHFQGKINISKEIWKWINLELWFRKFVD